MQHKTLTDVRAEAAVVEPAAMSRREKLERWATLLADRGQMRIRSLSNVEYAPLAHRDHLREDNSILSLAYADPILRAAGLENDTYGAAMRFFDLGHGKMHKLVCRCHLGSYVAADKLSSRVRGMGMSTSERIGAWASNLGRRAAAHFS